MTALSCLLVLLLIVTLVCTNSEEQSCKVDGTCDSSDADCEDKHESCQFWADQGECESNAGYMRLQCPKACDACVKGNDEFGVIQSLDPDHVSKIEEALSDMKAYFKKLRDDPLTTEASHELLDNCKNKHESCALWKVMGECEQNPEYMKLDCSAICQTCEFLLLENRCPLDPDAPQAWKSGDLDKFFVNMTTLPEFQKYKPVVISRPEFINGDTKETADYQLGPWVVTLDNFVTTEEADRLVQLGYQEVYERSTDVGEIKFDGSAEGNVNDGRTSKNAWCQHGCYNDTVAKQVIDRITEISNLPEKNSEYLQLLRYEAGQYYRTHHDFIPHHRDRQCGVRLITVFLYLNDVEEGGGTMFPMLSPPVIVTPKKGRALIWPSVLNDDPDNKDHRTLHSALVVEKGLKYGANAWIHMRDFKTASENGCI